MNRRELIRSLAMTAGCGLAAELAWPSAPAPQGHQHGRHAAIAAAHRAPRKSLFTSAQRRSVDVLVELILPKTDTPGAGEAGVGNFVDQVVSEWYQRAERAQFLAGLGSLDGYCIDWFGHNFNESQSAQQVMALGDAEQRSLAYQLKGRAAADAIADEQAPFFYRLRALVVLGYYTSELGATLELSYNPVPGSYVGDFDFDKVGHQWSS